MNVSCLAKSELTGENMNIYEATKNSFCQVSKTSGLVFAYLFFFINCATRYGQLNAN